MKITFKDDDQYTYFQIDDYDKKYIPVFEQCFWQKDGNTYYKKFSLEAKGIEKIKEHFANNARKMFDQLGYFTEIPWEKGLLDFVKRVESENIDWWLTGSCAVCLRGIKLNPHDVDIMINSKDLGRIFDIFKDDLIIPLIDTNGWVTKDFGVIFNGVRIDIASDPSPVLDDPEPVDCGPYAKEHLETITWNGYEILVPPLKLAANANKKRGRLERLKGIEEHLNNL